MSTLTMALQDVTNKAEAVAVRTHDREAYELALAVIQLARLVDSLARRVSP